MLLISCVSSVLESHPAVTRVISRNHVSRDFQSFSLCVTGWSGERASVFTEQDGLSETTCLKKHKNMLRPGHMQPAGKLWGFITVGHQVALLCFHSVTWCSQDSRAVRSQCQLLEKLCRTYFHVLLLFVSPRFTFWVLLTDLPSWNTQTCLTHTCLTETWDTNMS